MSLRSVLLATASICAYAVDAHMTLAEPVPFGKPDNGPITQQQWPCKRNMGYTITKMNTMAVGQKQDLVFGGEAVHGGGSCQLSITTDTEPTPDSVWKVIQSIEGGCPGVSAPSKNFTFTLPDSIPNGKGTFAWTWFAKLSGGPEMYMNCAPIEVTGGASDKSKFDALPDMFVGNLPGVSECQSQTSQALLFPDPGSDVVHGEGGGKDAVAPKGQCSAAAPAPSPSGGAGYPVSSAAGGQPSAAPSAAPSSAGGNNGQYTPPAGAGTSSAAATSAAATSAAAYPTGPAGGASSAASTTSEAAITSAATSAAAYPTGPAGGASSAVTSAATSAAAYPTGSAGGVFAPGASSAAPVASTQTTLVTVTGTPSVPSATVPLGTAPLGTGSSGAVPTSAPAAGGSTSCPTDGAILCNGPTQFGICDHGSVKFMPVAAGTTCSNGSIQKRAYHGRVARVRRNRSLFSHAHRN